MKLYLPSRKPYLKMPQTLDSKDFLSSTFVDVFAGCGGLSLGLMEAGWQGLFAIEHDVNAFATLQHNLIKGPSQSKFVWPAWLPKSPHSAIEIVEKYKDEFSKLKGKVDMLVGGPPCQGFSSAGRRDPNDPRNQLVTAYLHIVEALEPHIVLIENVKGITLDFDASSENDEPSLKRNYASEIIDKLSKNYVVHSRLLDVSQFGVPQKRHRFFILAIRKPLARAKGADPFLLIEKERPAFLLKKKLSSIPVSARSAISDLLIAYAGKVPSRDSEGFDEIAYVGPATSYQRLMNSGCDGAPSDTRLARHRGAIEDRFAKLIKICNDSGRLNTSLSPEVRTSFGLKKCAIRVLDPDAPAPTITSMPDDLIHFCEPRTLTVRENARLQSFPDWFSFRGKYTSGGHRRRKEVPRFTQVANAVPPLIAECIGLTLLKYYFGSALIGASEVRQESAQMLPVFQGA